MHTHTTRKELFLVTAAALLPSMGAPAQPLQPSAPSQLEQDMFKVARNCTCCDWGERT